MGSNRDVASFSSAPLVSARPPSTPVSVVGSPTVAAIPDILPPASFPAGAAPVTPPAGTAPSDSRVAHLCEARRASQSHLLTSTTVNDVADLVAAWCSSARLWGHSHCQAAHIDCSSPHGALVILDLLDRIRDGTLTLCSCFLRLPPGLGSGTRNRRPTSCSYSCLPVGTFNPQRGGISSSSQGQPGHRNCILVCSVGGRM